MAHSSNMFSVYFSVIVLLVVNNVLLTDAGEKCSLDDPACVKQTASNFYESLIEGVPGMVTSSDPLMIEQVIADLPGLKCTFNNCKLSGLKKCNIEHFVLNRYEKKYDYKMKCTHLILESDYEISGNLGDLPIEGKDKFIYEGDDFLISIHGDFKSYNTSDGKLHFRSIDTKIETSEPLGKVTFNFQNLFKGVPEKAAAIYKYIQENAKDVDKIIRPSIMEVVISSFMVNVNEFYQMVSIQDIFKLINRFEKKYDYKMKCPHLVLESDYEISGKLGDLPIEGKDKLIYEGDDFLFSINGDFKSYNSSDGKLHFCSIKTGIETSEPLGNVTFNYQNLFKGDQQKAAAIYKYLQENAKNVDKIIRPPMMEVVINSFMNNVNEFYQMVSIQDLFKL